MWVGQTKFPGPVWQANSDCKCEFIRTLFEVSSSVRGDRSSQNEYICRMFSGLAFGQWQVAWENMREGQWISRDRGK